MQVRCMDLGRMDYLPCAELQKNLLERVALHEEPGALILVEHPPVLTLGANFHAENLLLTPQQYQERGIEVLRTERGGDVTYHGPGQLVLYPVFDLSEIGRDLHKWMRMLEETMLRTLAAFGLEGYRFPPHTGAWVNGAKVAAIGVKVRKWVSMHGIALNCDNDLSPFQLIVPCGIQGHGVTSLSRELCRDVPVAEAKPKVIDAFVEVFGIEWI